MFREIQLSNKLYVQSTFVNFNGKEVQENGNCFQQYEISLQTNNLRLLI